MLSLIIPFVISVIVMVYFGTGYCDQGYYAGWNDFGGIGKESREACNAVCLSEAQCTYAAWNPTYTCSRYNVKTCNLDPTINQDFFYHEIFKKQTTSSKFIRKLFRLFDRFLEIMSHRLFLTLCF